MNDTLNSWDYPLVIPAKAPECHSCESRNPFDSAHWKKQMKSYYVYILASKKSGTLYVGVTNDLRKRIFEHKNGLVQGFTNKYKIHNLVYYESTPDVHSAIAKEKRLKKWKRAWKIELIEKVNPDWHDLYDSL